MARTTVTDTTAMTSIASNVRRLSIASLAAATSVVLVGSGIAQAQPAADAAVGAGDASWTVVEDPLLVSRGHSFANPGDIVGNQDAFLISRFVSCGSDCLQLMRSVDGLAWELVVIDGPGRRIADLAAGDDGFAALVVDGPSNGWPGPDNVWYAFTSDDGRAWSEHAIEPTRPGDIINAIASTPGSLAAVGCDTRIEQLEGRARREPFCRQAVVWTSSDGSTWTREQLESGRLVELASVAVMGDTIVATGSDFTAGRNEPGKPAVFTRPAGGSWSRTEPSGIDRGLLAVQTSPQHGFVLSPTVDWGLLSHGNIDFDAPISERYASSDGIDWTALAEPRIRADATDDETRLASLVESSSGAAAIATTRTATGRRNWRESSRFWRSDGETWRSFSLPADGYADDGGLLLAIGPEGRTLMVNDSGTMLLVGPDAAVAEGLAVGPIAGRAAVPLSPLGSEAQSAYLSVSAVEPGACSTLRGRAVRRAAPGAVSVIDCGVDDGTHSVRHHLFPSEADLDAWWAATVERDDRDIVEVDDVLARCAQGQAAAGAWQTADGSLSGDVACHGQGDEAIVAWTTPTALIGSMMTAKGEALASVASPFVQGRSSVPIGPTSGTDDEPAAAIPDPGPIDPQARRETERMILSALRPFACKPWREEDEPFMWGAHAAVRCGAPAPGVSQLALFAFEDEAELDSFWTWRRSRISPLLDWTAGCQDGREGATTWEHGSAACYVRREGRGLAQIRWTDDRTGTYGVLDATSANLPDLVGWWQTNDPSGLAPVSIDTSEALDGRLPDDAAGQLRYLRRRVSSPSRCRPMSSTALARTEPGAIAGLDCMPTRQERNNFDMRSLRYLLFPSSRSMNAWWDTARHEAAPGGVAADSGSLGMCTNIFSETPVESGWITRDGKVTGRILCVPQRGIRWTVGRDLVAAETNAAAWWFLRAHPDRVERYRELDPGEKPHPPFARPRSLRPLPAGIGDEATGSEVYVGRPTSGRGLPVGVIHPISLGHCDGMGFSPDVDGSFWQVTGGIGPDGKPVKRNAGYRQFGESGVVEFMKISKDRAQLRTASGYVFGYERHKGKRAFPPCA